MHSDKTMKIKLEIDMSPPLGFNTESKSILRPMPFWVKSYTLPDLFAGKLSAVLCRQWQKHVKGRDWYDFLWFVQNNVPVHLSHLEERLRAFNFYTEREKLAPKKLKQLLADRTNQLDVDLAKQDISKFIKQPQQLDAWNKTLFVSLLSELTFC